MTQLDLQELKRVAEELRACANGAGGFKNARGDFGLCDDAADAITRLQAERDDLSGLNVTLSICNDKLVKERDALRADLDAHKMLADVLSEKLERRTLAVEACDIHASDLRPFDLFGEAA